MALPSPSSLAAPVAVARRGEDQDAEAPVHFSRQDVLLFVRAGDSSTAPSLEALLATASPQDAALVRTILEHQRESRAWADQLGPSLTESDVACLLDQRMEDVACNPRLLRLQTRDGVNIYPVFQFQGRHPKSVVGDVVEAFVGALEPLTIAAWLSSAKPELDGLRPIDAIDGGATEHVVALARRAAQEM